MLNLAVRKETAKLLKSALFHCNGIRLFELLTGYKYQANAAHCLSYGSLGLISKVVVTLGQ